MRLTELLKKLFPRKKPMLSPPVQKAKPAEGEVFVPNPEPARPLKPSSAGPCIASNNAQSMVREERFEGESYLKQINEILGQYANRRKGINE